MSMGPTTQEKISQNSEEKGKEMVKDTDWWWNLQEKGGVNAAKRLRGNVVDDDGNTPSRGDESTLSQGRRIGERIESGDHDQGSVALLSFHHGPSRRSR